MFCPKGSTSTSTPTPIGTPMTGILSVIVGFCETASGAPCDPDLQFQITVSGNNPQPSLFTLTDNGTQVVTLGAGVNSYETE